MLLFVERFLSGFKEETLQNSRCPDMKRLLTSGFTGTSEEHIRGRRAEII